MVESLMVIYAAKIFNETSKQMFVKIWDIVNEKHDDVKELITSIDLDSKVELVESVVRDIHDDMKEHHIHPNNSLNLSLNKLMEIIQILHNDLNEIKKGIEYHKTLWFNYFRTPSYYNIMEKVKDDKKLLDSRFDDLVKIISLFKQNNFDNSIEHNINSNIDEKEK
jgi:hypothetical protein